MLKGVVADLRHIYNVSGQEVAAGHLAPGIYLVQVKTATGTLTKKVTKK